MRFNVVRDYALQQLGQFKTSGSVQPGQREPLLDAAANARFRNLTDEFQQSRAADQSDNDLDGAKGVLHTLRGPRTNESFERTVESRTTLKGTLKKGEMASHELATLRNDEEPYQDTYCFTKFQSAGIAHVSIAILGDGGVGNGYVSTTAEFLSSEPGQSWRERTAHDFLSGDLLGLYAQGTYKPAL